MATQDSDSAATSAGIVVSIGLVWLLLAILWAVLGLAALAYSFFCFARSGNSLDKVVGTVLALTLGPLYWLYLAVNTNYCR